MDKVGIRGCAVGCSSVVVASGDGGKLVSFMEERDRMPRVISPRETYELAQNGNTLLLDVRTLPEYNNELGHVAQSVLIPIQELEQRLAYLEPSREKTIIVICRSGNRSGRAAEFLGRHGFTALNMEGGMIRWNQEGLPIARS